MTINNNKSVELTTGGGGEFGTGGCDFRRKQTQTREMEENIVQCQ